MPLKTVHETFMNDYLLAMIIRNSLMSPDHASIDKIKQLSDIDVKAFLSILLSRYPNGRDNKVPKTDNIHLAWIYAEDPSNHHRFEDMLRVTPLVFQTILTLIEEHPVFYNSSNHPQAPVEKQLAVTLYRMGRYGNGASVQDIARIAGCSEGSVDAYTNRCFEAIESLHDLFVRRLTPAEKEIEKTWIDTQIGFQGTWREGWVMYDGTIVVLYKKPGLNGDAYYTRKGNYGLNVQIGNTPSNLRIVDYSHGMTGSAHDAAAFEHTSAAAHPTWFFDREEFAWADSAYAVNSRTIPVHKKPASLDPANTLFDKYVAHLQVRSEHCMGALKGRFQCLRGLRVNINSNRDHHSACQWITDAIILHNLIIDVEGAQSGATFAAEHGPMEEFEDRGEHEENNGIDDADAEKMRRRLVAEIVAFKEM